MQLTLSQVAKLFDVSENTITGWVREESLPAEVVNSQYRFERTELLEWSALKKKNCSPKVFQEVNGDQIGKLSLADAMEYGGVLYDVPTESKESVFAAALENIPLPDGFDRQLLLDLMLARESLCSSGVGDGIAIPHPRYPVVLELPRPAVRLCFLAQPMDFQSSDNKLVDKLFVMICPTVHCHLQLLALLATALRDERLRSVLSTRADCGHIVKTVREVEYSLHPSK
jgi:PTS system nitrogen regulatory IIA component